MSGEALLEMIVFADSRIRVVFGGGVASAGLSQPSAKLSLRRLEKRFTGFECAPLPFIGFRASACSLSGGSVIGILLLSIAKFCGCFLLLLSAVALYC